MTPLVGIIGFALAIAVAVLLVIYVLVPIFAIAGKLVGHIFKFISSMIRDFLRAVSAIITLLVLAPLIAGSIVIGRWSAASHFGRAVQYECTMFGRCVYRIAIGNPAHLLGLGVLTEGIEQRIPEAVGKAPRADKPSKRTGQFDGYTIVGSLTGGGSGAKLYVAEASEQKLASFRRAGHGDIDQVVIKSFSVRDGSSLPQIVRESRSLEAARKLGLVLDHELNDTRFYYVMPYVPGDDLSTATHKLHDASNPEGLGRRQLDEALNYVAELLQTLDRYHRGGLWHKDVKPDNIIVHNGHAQIVDLGLVTPMRSAMTLTTHGTEYFRDPEMVRMALRGVKVHEVDGAKFDIYATGAVLFSLIENSFPAHGGLSHVTKKCPDALRLVIRRSMSEYNSRYPTAPAMLADLRLIMDADDPYSVKPADLPSMRGQSPDVEKYAEESFEPAPPAQPVATPAAPAYSPAAPPPAPVGRTRPRLRVSDWWTGRYVSDQDIDEPFGAVASPVRRSPAPPAASASPVAPGQRRPASEQLQRARARARDARARAHQHRRDRMQTGRYSNRPNHGVALGLGVFALLFVGILFLAGLVMSGSKHNAPVLSSESVFDSPSVAIAPAPVDFSQNEAARKVVESITSALKSIDNFNLDDLNPAVIANFLKEASEKANASTPNAPTAATAVAVASSVAQRGDLLIIDDLRSGPTDVRNRVLASVSRSLRSSGIRLLRAEDDDATQQLEDEARKEIGADHGVVDTDTRHTLTDWLSQQPRSLKGVLVLSWTGQGDDQKPSIQVIARRGFDGVWLKRQLQQK